VHDASDNALMQAVREGDTEALGVLFERHQARVRALCFRITRRADVADDLVQETFLRILRHRQTFRADSAFTTWLYRLAFNVCQDYWQRARREMPVPAPAEHVPNDLSDLSERYVLLDEAMARLAPDRRTVLVLARYHDLGYDDIARVLDCTPAAARVRAHRALTELREIYRELEQRQHDLRSRAGVDRGQHSRPGGDG
jgi:RNA polymerase sigma factor (sigma-70 family)